MTLRRRLISLLLLSLAVVGLINLARLTGFQYERRSTDLERNALAFERDFIQVLRGINESLLTEGSPQAVGLIVRTLPTAEAAFDRLHDAVGDDLDALHARWHDIIVRLEPFRLPNSALYYDDQALVAYGTLLADSDALLVDMRAVIARLHGRTLRAMAIADAVSVVALLLGLGLVLFIFREIRRRVSEPLAALSTALDEHADPSSTLGSGDFRRLRMVLVSQYAQEQKALPEEIQRVRGSITAMLDALLEALGEKERVAQSLAQQSRSNEHRATHDVLTALPNRAHFKETLEQVLVRTGGREPSIAVMFIDLDRFKPVNDNLGHEVGDKLLCAVAERLAQCFRQVDTLCRVGGDEFAAIVDAYGDVATLDEIAGRVTDSLGRPFRIDDHQLSIGASIGISISPGDGDDAEALTRNADTAMYAAKAEGRGRHRYYTAELNMRADVRTMLEERLHDAMARGQLHTVYQPQVTLATGAVVAMECLLRWDDPDAGAVSPDEFIPIAEETGLIHELGDWVLGEACRNFTAWREAGIAPRRVVVNVSAAQFRRAHFSEDVLAVLARYGLEAGELEIDLGEEVLTTHDKIMVENLASLAHAGVKLALDDFGRGESSLTRLHGSPVHRLKLDRSVVAAVSVNPGQAALASAILSMATELGIETVGEGVENEDQQRFLVRHGCVLAQGFYFSRPLPEIKATAWLLASMGGGEARASR